MRSTERRVAAKTYAPSDDVQVLRSLVGHHLSHIVPFGHVATIANLRPAGQRVVPAGSRRFVGKEQAMHSFHGDLLLGGAAIREVDGLIEDEGHKSDQPCAGRFRLNANQESLLELNRTYLLMLDDGSSAKIVVTDVTYEDDEDNTVIVQFRPR